MSELSKLEKVRNALRQVMDPDLKKDLVTLNMIRDLAEDGKAGVSFRVVLTTPACPVKALLEDQCRKAALSVSGVAQVKVTMDSEVRSKLSGGVAPSHAIAGVSHIIAVSSGKGGVGKSTVAVNLATALVQEGARVGLLDADIYGPNVPTMMGVTDSPTIENHPTRGEIFIPPQAHGVKVMSMGFLIQGDQPVVWRGPMLHSVVTQFCHKVDWGELDYLIVDMPPGTGDVQLSLSQLVPLAGAVLVTTPQEVSVQDVRKAFHMFEKVRVPIFGIVENMSYFVCNGCTKKHLLWGEGGGSELARKLNSELLAQIPIVSQIREAGDFGRPLVTQKNLQGPELEVREIFQHLAQKVAQKASILAHTPDASPASVQIGQFH